MSKHLGRKRTPTLDRLVRDIQQETVGKQKSSGLMIFFVDLNILQVETSQVENEHATCVLDTCVFLDMPPPVTIGIWMASIEK